MLVITIWCFSEMKSIVQCISVVKMITRKNKSLFENVSENSFLEQFLKTVFSWFIMEWKPLLVNLSTFTKALLCKWSWWFGNEKEALRFQVVRGKYGEERRSWCTKE